MTISRRMFLRGAGGFTLALPLLPSLLPATAHAQSGARPRRFVTMATQHGGIWNDNMWPSLSEQTMDYAGRTIRHADITSQAMGGQTVISPVLTADSGKLTQSLVGKINLLRGIDVPWYLGHHTGGYLGNYGRNDGNGTPLVTDFHPTLDQVLAWSPNFYSDLDGVLKRSMVMGRDRMSYMWSNPSERTGDIQAIAPENSSMSIFDEIFVPPEDNEDPRTPVVDRVLESYQRLRNGNGRLSSRDRQRLDDHMERIYELQRRLNTFSSCTDIETPAADSREVRRVDGFRYDPDLNRQFWQLQNEVIAIAFTCGSSQVVSMNVADNFSTFNGDWHQDVAHQADEQADKQDIIAAAHQRFFEDVFVDLCAKLEIDEGDGSTILDNTLIQWVQESGPKTHDPLSMPVVTAGSAGGYFTTGKYVDFGNKGIRKSEGNPYEASPGICHNQWLGTVARAMGLEREEFDLQGHGGFGYLSIHRKDDWFAKSDWWPSAVESVVGQDLPIIT